MVLSEVIAVEKEVPRYDHIAQMGRVKERMDALRSLAEPPEMLIMNFQYPGHINHIVIFTTSRGVNDSCADDEQDTVIFKRMWKKFRDTIPDTEEERMAICEREVKSGWKWIPSDTTWAKHEEKGVFPVSDFKNQRYKMIPVVSEGHWLVKSAFRAALPAQMPCLLGKHLQMRYFKGEDYIEMDVDIGSSTIASHVVTVMRAFNRSVIMEYAIVIQGEEDSAELPERILACQSVNYMDCEHNYRINDPIVLLENDNMKA